MVSSKEHELRSRKPTLNSLQVNKPLSPVSESESQAQSDTDHPDSELDFKTYDAPEDLLSPTKLPSSNIHSKHFSPVKFVVRLAAKYRYHVSFLTCLWISMLFLPFWDDNPYALVYYIADTIRIIPFLFLSEAPLASLFPSPNLSLHVDHYKILTSPSVCEASESQCCFTIGPIIGHTDSSSTRISVEPTLSGNLTLTLTPTDKKTGLVLDSTSETSTTPADPQPQAISITHLVRATRINTYEFVNLLPDTRYTITVSDSSSLKCKSPIDLPEMGVVYTRPVYWSITRPLRIAAVSCNNSVRARARAVDPVWSEGERTPGILWSDLAVRALLNDKFKYTSKDSETAASSTTSTSTASTSKDMMIQQENIDIILHLGDQIYADTSANGLDWNIFLHSQQIILDDLINIQNKAKVENRIISFPLEGVYGVEIIACPECPPNSRVNFNALDLQNADIKTALFAKLPEPFPVTLVTGQQISVSGIPVASLVSKETRKTIRELYRKLYRVAWSDPAVRITLSRVPSTFILDDHDVFDDFGDAEADDRIDTPRGVIVRAALEVYREYQFSLSPNAKLIHGQGTDVYDKYNKDSKKIQAGVISETNESDTDTHTHTHGDAAAELSEKINAVDTSIYSISPLSGQKSWTFQVFGDICIAVVDIRALRSPGRFTTTSTTKSINDATTLLGPDQWNDLRSALALESKLTTSSSSSSSNNNEKSGNASSGSSGSSNLSVDEKNAMTSLFSNCRSLVVASSIPTIFVAPQPNAVVGAHHDDMLGHWSAPEFRQEQRDFLTALELWRTYPETCQMNRKVDNNIKKTNKNSEEDIKKDDSMKTDILHSNDCPAAREVTLIGGDVHGGGYTRIRINLPEEIPHATTATATTTTTGTTIVNTDDIDNTNVTPSTPIYTSSNSKTRNLWQLSSSPVNNEVLPLALNFYVAAVFPLRYNELPLVPRNSLYQNPSQFGVDHDKNTRIKFKHIRWNSNANYGIVEIGAIHNGAEKNASQPPCVRITEIRRVSTWQWGLGLTPIPYSEDVTPYVANNITKTVPTLWYQEQWIPSDACPSV